MSDLSPEEYQKEYDAEMAKLEAAGTGTPVPTPAPAVAPVPAVTPAPAAVVDPEAKKEAVEEPQETVEELKQRLARAEKEAHDNKAWGTKNAQELAEARRREREANKPQILDANPDLEEAIRYVATSPVAAPDPATQEQLRHQQFIEIVDRAHPGIFEKTADEELIAAIAKRKDDLGDEWLDPLTAIRVISETKLAHAESQTRKRFAAEAETRMSKSAMAVPGAGGGSAAKPAAPTAEDEANRIRNMSDADFEKERRRVLGY